MPLTFSVIIPAKNEIKALPHLLAEIALQTLQPLEVIVADAQSTDGTAEAARAAGATVIAGGLPGVGRNAGAAVAAGEILVFLDADVYLEDCGMFARMMAEVEGRNLQVGATDVYVVDGGVWASVAHELYNAYVHVAWRVLGVPHAPGACLVVRREAFVRLGGFDTELRLAEDMDLALRAVKTGGYGFLRTVRIGLDTRRMRHDGWFKLIATYVRMELSILLFRRVPHSAHYALDYERPDRKKVQ